VRLLKNMPPINMKFVPNLFTLLNLFFGCVAIVMVMQNGLVITPSAKCALLLLLPEKIYLASLFIAIAAVVDFLDGFVARLFKASSELGKQLDSLADVVSFGVAPAMIVYQFLRLAYAQQPDGLSVWFGWLLPAFIIPCAGAYRLGRYNLDNSQSVSFKGVPIPAVGMLIAAFPLIYWYANNGWVSGLLLSPWFWYAVIAVVSWLMASTLPMMALKFSKDASGANKYKIGLVVFAIAALVLLKWIAVPLIFLVYVLLSIVTRPSIVR